MSTNENGLFFLASFFGKKKQKTAKANLVLFNYVHDDGIGDFKHLCDFLPHFDRLLTPLGVDIIIFIINRHDESSDQTAYIKEKITGFPQRHKYLLQDSSVGHRALNDLIEKNNSRRKMLQRTQLIIDISVNCSYKHVLKKYIPSCVKCITLAEISQFCTLDKAKYLLGEDDYLPDKRYVMGLGDDNAGMKLMSGLLNSLDSAMDAFKHMEDRHFIHALLNTNDESAINGPSIDEFFEHHYFIPAYLQDKNTILGFISLFCNNKKLQGEGKDIHFLINNFQGYFSKIDGNSAFVVDLLQHRRQWALLLRQSGIKSLAIACYQGEKEVIDFNTKGRVMTIHTGYRFSDDDYRRVYAIPQCFAGASGDNTMENMINHGLLFFMQHKFQWPTFLAIAKIAAERMNDFGFTKEEVNDFELYFSNWHYYICHLDDKGRGAHALMSDVDLLRLARNMPTLCSYLIEERNVVDQLPKILGDHLDLSGERSLEMSR